MRVLLCGARNPLRVALDIVEEHKNVTNVINLSWLLCSHEMCQRGSVRRKEKKNNTKTSRPNYGLV